MKSGKLRDVASADDIIRGSDRDPTLRGEIPDEVPAEA
jgi:hypothetical protein